jgi:hypothetical protein
MTVNPPPTFDLGHVLLKDPRASNPVIFETSISGVPTTFRAFQELNIVDGFTGGTFREASGCGGITSWFYRNLQLRPGAQPLAFDRNDSESRFFDPGHPALELCTVYRGQVRLTWDQEKRTLFLPVQLESKESLVEVRVVNRFVPSLSAQTIRSVLQGTMATSFPYHPSQIRFESHSSGPPAVVGTDQTYLMTDMTLFIS